MHFQKTLAAAAFGFGVTSVMAQCKHVTTGLDDNVGAIYATGLSGDKLLAIRYHSMARNENLLSLLYDICSEMEFCAYQPYMNGQCFDGGSDLISSLMNQNTPTDEILSQMQDYANQLIEQDDQFATRRGEDVDALRQSADDMFNNAAGPEYFLENDF